ncbi:MAG: hypothetical protein HRU09_13300 [Oligoflexales bacterium]|nr:hypothetical protein [Oligoflexales bacterium]
MTCFGCEADPYRSNQKSPSPEVVNFTGASVQRSLPSANLGNKSWGLSEFSKKYKRSNDELKVELEAFVLAANLISYFKVSSSKNALVCPKNDYDFDTGICRQPAMYINDLGVSFGADDLFAHSSGDFYKWSEKPVFKDRSTCRVNTPFDGIKYISEQGKAFLLQRLEKPDLEKLKLIFESAHFELVDSHLKSEITKANRDSSPGTINQLIVARWAEALQDRVREIASVSCPDLTKTVDLN